MASLTLASRLLDAAELLLANSHRSSTFRRRAVSTAYYATFHAIDKLCADYVTRSAPRNSDEYRRAYRALDHAPLKIAFSHSPLKDVPRLSKIGETIVKLQAERHRADYLPPISGLFPHDSVKDLIAQAREVVFEIESIKPSHKDCRLLATSLLFKDR